MSETFQRRRSRKPSLRELMRALGVAARNSQSVWHLYTASRDTCLGKYLAHRPEIWEMLITPYLSASWNAFQRLRRVIDHCATTEKLGPLFTAPWNGYVVLTTLPEIGPQYRLILDQPRWLLREGQSAISIWDCGDRLFSLSYCLSSVDGKLVVYVGGVQGRPGEEILERFRRLTKSAHGMRPTDLIIELSKMVFNSIGAERVLCVSDENRQQKSDYYNGKLPIMRPLNAIWTERGATRQDDGFFSLPATPLRRTNDHVPRKKRAIYRSRYEMLDAIATRIDETVQTGLRPEQLLIFGEESKPWPQAHA